VRCGDGRGKLSQELGNWRTRQDEIENWIVVMARHAVGCEGPRHGRGAHRQDPVCSLERSEHEAKRLEEQAKFFDRSTRMLFHEAGITTAAARGPCVLAKKWARRIAPPGPPPTGKRGANPGQRVSILLNFSLLAMAEKPKLEG
jgi:hypothetical protein